MKCIQMTWSRTDIETHFAEYREMFSFSIAISGLRALHKKNINVQTTMDTEHTFLNFEKYPTYFRNKLPNKNLYKT